MAGGFAVATSPGEDEAHGESILGAERLAASEGRGLWSATVCGGTGALPGIEIDAAGSRFDPEGGDEEMLDQEWVTFRSPVTLDLGGWTLRDESSAHRCALAPNSRIGPDLELTVTSADRCWDPGSTPVWNNDGDLVLLLDEWGRVAAHHRYDS